MAEDEQIALGSPGDVMVLGLCAQDALVDSPNEFSREGITAVVGAPDHRYRIDGHVLFTHEFETVGSRRESPVHGTELIVDAGVCCLVVRPRVGGPAVKVGDQVGIEGPWTVIAEYEWDDFAISDVRADWLLRSFEVVGENYLLKLEAALHHERSAR